MKKVNPSSKDGEASGPNAGVENDPARHSETRSEGVVEKCITPTKAEMPSPDEAHASREKAILTVDELADLLRLNRKTIYEAIDRGEIPGVRRIGESYRIHRATVLEWFASSQGRVSHSRRHR